MAAARFYADAFASQPTLADDLQSRNRCNAARAAALAGIGKGEDASDLDDKECARLRKEALDWLRGDLAAWGKLTENGPPQARAVVRQTLSHWKEDADLAGVRDALDKLPEDQRADWKKLWADVDALLKEAWSTQGKQRIPALALACAACHKTAEGRMSLLAYHLTWTTYGTWLPGDGCGWVRSGRRGVMPPDAERERDARQRMVESPVILTDDQRAIVEQTIADHCRIRGWLLHAVNARSTTSTWS